MEDCGQPLSTFHDLSMKQRYAPFISTGESSPHHARRMLASHVAEIHRRKVSHEDLEPRNVVASETEQLTIIDFELSNISHTCQKSRCSELQFISTLAMTGLGLQSFVLAGRLHH
jgi:tRNA A-37 threonylcarbamoyl transferase component Bud32